MMAKKIGLLLGLGLVACFCMAAMPVDGGTSGFHWLDIVKGLVSGAVAAALGYVKSQSEKFNAAKFAKTSIFGGIVGGIAAWRGTSMDEAEKWAAMIGVSLAFSFIWDALIRKVAAPGIAKVRMLAQARAQARAVKKD